MVGRARSRLVPPGASGSGQVEGQNEHDHGDDDVEDAPCRRPGEDRLQEARAIAEREEPHKRRKHRAGTEAEPRIALVAAGNGAERDDRIQIDMRVEEGERQAGGGRLRQRRAATPVGLQRAGLPGATQRDQAIGGEEGGAGPGDDTDRRLALRDQRAETADADRENNYFPRR